MWPEPAQVVLIALAALWLAQVALRRIRSSDG